MSWEVVMYFEGSQVRVSTVVVSKSSMSKFSKLPSSSKSVLYTQSKDRKPDFRVPSPSNPFDQCQPWRWLST